MAEVDVRPRLQAGAPEKRPKQDDRSRWATKELLEKYTLPGLLIATIVVFTVLPSTSSTFPTELNFQNVTGNESVLAIAALAALLPLVAGQFDLSIGAVIGFSSILCSGMMTKHGLPLVPAIGVACGVGAIVGLVNGLCVTKAKIDALITTLGTATILTALVTWYSNGLSFVEGISPGLVSFGTGTTAGVPQVAFVVVAAAIAVYFLLEHLPFGRNLQAVGSNATAARLVGLNVDRLVIASFVMSGILAGLAAVLQVARSGGGNPQIGPGFTLPALAAGFLGATTIKPGRYNVQGTIVAVLFLAALTSGLTLAGVASWVNQAVDGVALLVGVGLAKLMNRERAGR